jgi:hypothetical protein
MPILQTPEDVVRELRRNPNVEYDLWKPNEWAPIRLYARPNGLITVWFPKSSRPIHGVVKLTTFDLGDGPYDLRPV